MSGPTASQIVAEAKHDSVTRDRLTKTGTGGILSSEGYLRDKALLTYIDSDELPHYILTNMSKGLSINEHGDENAYKSYGGYGSFAAITNKRILIVVPCESRDRSWSINYSSIKNVNVNEGYTKNKLSIINGKTEYGFYFSPSDLASDELIDLKEHINKNLEQGITNNRDENERRKSSSTSELMHNTIDESNFASEIKKLRELKQSGVLSEEEFENKKSDILDRL